MTPAPHDPPRTSEARLREVTVGEPQRLDGPVRLAEYDPSWPEWYAREEGRIRAAIGDRVDRVEHVGSTSVPGLAAKPRIDIVVVVRDSAEEGEYAPGMEIAGYELRVREPDWHEHRLFRRAEPAVNVHVFSRGCTEVTRMLAFRDHLRTDAADRALYEARKRELAARTWDYLQHYADAKTAVIADIMARALARRDAAGSAS